MLTPPGPTRRPTTIRTIPKSSCPRIAVTMPAITRITAISQRSVVMLCDSLRVFARLGSDARAFRVFYPADTRSTPRRVPGFPREKGDKPHHRDKQVRAGQHRHLDAVVSPSPSRLEAPLHRYGSPLRQGGQGREIVKVLSRGR